MFRTETRSCWQTFQLEGRKQNSRWSGLGEASLLYCLEAQNLAALRDYKEESFSVTRHHVSHDPLDTQDLIVSRMAVLRDIPIHGDSIFGGHNEQTLLCGILSQTVAEADCRDALVKTAEL